MNRATRRAFQLGKHVTARRADGTSGPQQSLDRRKSNGRRRAAIAKASRKANRG